MLHHLWGKAKEHADYDKKEWMEFQRRYELPRLFGKFDCSDTFVGGQWRCPEHPLKRRASP